MRQAWMLVGTLLAIWSCGEPSGVPTIRISYAGAAGPSSGLPDEVDRVIVDVLEPGATGPLSRQSFDRAELTGDSAYAVVRQLPTLRPIEIRVWAMLADAVAYTAQVGPITLARGERRYVDLLLVPAHAVTAMGPLPEARAMHSATTLSDGRVLLAGGVTQVALGQCQEDAPDSSCFNLIASRRAWLYDPATGSIHRTRSDLLQARAAHTATLLADGRVLVSGGFDTVQLVLHRRPPGLEPGLASLHAAGSFELFDPERDAQIDDVESDGDPGRGGFVGSASNPEAPGSMGYARAFHTATAIPNTRAVLVAGGGDAQAAATVELFDLDNQGGRFLPIAGGLRAPRFAHSATATVEPGEDRSTVWIFGGVIGEESSPDVAELFTVQGIDPFGQLGRVEAAAFGDLSNPLLNLVGAGAATVGDGRFAVVLGWLGPRCSPEPGFVGDFCGPADRSFAVDGLTGQLAQPVGKPGAHHAFGVVVPSPDGAVFVSGGFEDLSLTATSEVQRLTGAVQEPAQPVVDDSFDLSLADGRAFLAGNALPDGTLVVSGGLRLQGGTPVLSARLELVNPRRVLPPE